ncbi:DUF2845 domain-containing protein [Xylophilus rhododendri]|uniref:DUF2845 domain-containing protein n=2 Tax=Xylophilus rhododendri TaxID=2697032 RepID=A0A857JFR3_9BURK|nr:DUF2845 domain-containing protein [Xylophilus rhododendri]
MSCAPAFAAEQSLSCNGFLVGKGEPAESLIRKCGEPIDFQAVCVSLLQINANERPIRSEAERMLLASHCVRMDEWLYDRGPGTFYGIVRIRDGVVESVRDGARGR